MFQRKPEVAQQRIADGTTWKEFCQILQSAGDILQQGPQDPRTQAEGVRYLTRLVRAGLEAYVEFADPQAPVLHRVVHETAKIGADNPEHDYLTAAVSGKEEYRVWGSRGSVQWLEFATQKGQYGEGRGMPATGHLDAKDMHIEADGSFELVMSVDKASAEKKSTDKKKCNWLPMELETGTLIVRQSRLDPGCEELAQIHIEPLGGETKPAPLTPQQMDEGLMRSAMLVGGAARIFVGWADGFQEHTNKLPRFDPATSNMMGGVPDIAYYHSYWKLEPDECLVVEATPPPCDHWNFQINNHWMESLDYRYHRIHTNSALFTPEPDGSIRLVVAHKDPGHPNWLETTGLGLGTMCFRWVRPEGGEPPEPSCRVVKFADFVAQQN